MDSECITRIGDDVALELASRKRNSPIPKEGDTNDDVAEKKISKYPKQSTYAISLENEVLF
jgi:hypothetical protein